MSTVKATTLISDISGGICSPFLDKSGDLHVLLQDVGDVLLVEKSGKRVHRMHCTGGQPSSALFDKNGILYVTDFGHAAVLAVQDGGQQEVIVGTYEDKPLKGPSSIVQDSKGTVYFADSGPLGETGLHCRHGSLFMITSGGSQMLKPISLENLASPSAVALSPDGKFLYVAEMMTNRVLRYFQKPEGVFHGSVFYQCSGRVGPSCLACDKQGSIYVGHYDTRGSSVCCVIITIMIVIIIIIVIIITLIMTCVCVWVCDRELLRWPCDCAEQERQARVHHHNHRRRDKRTCHMVRHHYVMMTLCSCSSSSSYYAVVVIVIIKLLLCCYYIVCVCLFVRV